MKLKFSQHIFQKYSNTKFREFHQLGAELFRAGGRKDRLTDITKLIVVFRKFANVFFPKIVSYMI
jgi:hypothetical protein